MYATQADVDDCVKKATGTDQGAALNQITPPNIVVDAVFSNGVIFRNINNVSNK